MRNNEATARTPRWNKPIGAVLVLLSLTGTGVPNSWAQLQYNGGYVQTDDDDDGFLPIKTRKAKPHSSNAPPSLFPDNDFYYPLSNQAAAFLDRSYYYYAGGRFGQPAPSPAGQMPLSISAAVFPWNQPGFSEYRDFPEPAPNMPFSSPRKYSLVAVALSQSSPASVGPGAVLVAHLPEHALFWVEEVRTRSTGRTRYFNSPPLRPGREYSYTVRAAWIEDGRWVSQPQRIAVQAGMIQAIYLRSRFDSALFDTRR